jgi:gas vesicle protein
LSNNNNNINSKDFLIGTLIGGIVGAASALLMAPKSGKELRSDINNQAAVVKDRTVQIKDTALEKSNEFAVSAKERSSTIARTVSDQSNQVASKVRNVTTALKDDVNKWRTSRKEADLEGEENNNEYEDQAAAPSATIVESTTVEVEKPVEPVENNEQENKIN